MKNTKDIVIDKITVLIPVYKASDILVDLVKALQIKGLNSIIIVRDGVDAGEDYIFKQLTANCTVLNHDKNQGKGKALKTGLNYFITNEKFHDKEAIVTADADGQHSPEDIIKVAKAAIDNQYNLILGVRSFSKDIPLRSKIGNLITKKIFSFLIGKTVSDTQTGLRGIPKIYIEDFVKLGGNKYEYEMNMLIATRKIGINITEIEIETIYIENNKSSHFNPLIDSIKIYSLLIGFAFTSLISFLIDLVLFSVFLSILYKLFSHIDDDLNIWYASFLARVISMIFNYNINKKIIFSSNKSHIIALSQYLLLALISISISSLLVSVLSDEFKSTFIGTVLIKVGIEGVLFLFNFYIQNKYIFVSKNKNI